MKSKILLMKMKFDYRNFILNFKKINNNFLLFCFQKEIKKNLLLKAKNLFKYF